MNKKRRKKNDAFLYFLIWFFRDICWPGKIRES
jgi:hypothetical protein